MRLRLRLAVTVIVLAPAAWLACGLSVVGTEGAPPIESDGAAPSGDDGSVPIGDTLPDSGGDARAPCPTGPGPKMIDVGPFCIDATEVTEAQYAAFLAADGGTKIYSPPVCAWKRSLVPAAEKQACRWEPAKYPNLPVVCVDWCDAEAYCRWAGKRLCGAIGGGPVPWSGTAFHDAAVDQWYHACSNAGTQRYPYGSTFLKEACNVEEHDLGEVVDAGALADCTGGYPGIVDMVGNAFEHEDSCDLGDGGDGGDAGSPRFDFCRLRGGSWFHDDTMSNCDAFGAYNQRSDRFDDVGFRCCAP